MPRIVKIETSTIVPAEVGRVWEVLLDHSRWIEHLTEGSPARFDDVEPLDETFVRVGDRRRCAAVIDQLPLVGRRRLSWEEQVTDVDHLRTLEIESLPSRDPIRRWRLRFWLVPQPDATTRVRCHVSYRPASFAARLADSLFLRKRIALAAESWVANLAGSFTPAELAERPTPDLSEALVAA